MKVDFLTKEELTIKRTPQELIEWVERKIEEIAQQEGGKEAIRKRKGLCKQLMEEIYPLSIFAGLQFINRSDVTLQAVIGNQNYDAIITDDAFSPPYVSKLEITQAHEGENNYLKRLMLQEKGWAPISGYIEKKGTKNTGIELKPNLGVRGLEDYLNEQINLIRDVLKRKLQNKYESNTSLLIMFEDIISIDKKEDIRKALYQLVEHELGPKATQSFSALYLVSWSKQIFLKWSFKNDK